MRVEGARAEFLVGLVERHASPDSSILEVGCRSGANLVSLHGAGFRDLHGIEGDDNRVRRFADEHPSVAGAIQVKGGPVGESIGEFGDRTFDLVFTVGFFFEKDGDFHWLYPEIVRITGVCLISIEDEQGAGGGRRVDYGAIYGKLGMKEVEAVDLSRIEGLDSVFRARVFSRR